MLQGIEVVATQGLHALSAERQAFITRVSTAFLQLAVVIADAAETGQRADEALTIYVTLRMVARREVRIDEVDRRVKEARHCPLVLGLVLQRR
jgi:hypothetical protein